MIDFEKLLLTGLRLNNSEFLPNYFFREFKKAEKEHYSQDEFFGECRAILNNWTQQIDDSFESTMASFEMVKKQAAFDPFNGAEYTKWLIEQTELEEQATTIETMAIRFEIDDKNFASVKLRDIHTLANALEKAKQLVDANNSVKTAYTHPRIFTDERAEKLFFELVECFEISSDKQQLTEMTTIYRAMIKDGFIYSDIGEGKFREWLRDKIKLVDLNSQIKQAYRISSTHIKTYNTAKKQVFPHLAPTVL